MNLKYEIGQEVAIEAPKTVIEIKTSEIKSITVSPKGTKYLTSDGAFTEEQLDAFAESAQPQPDDKPTSKYKSGDKVRVIDNTCCHNFKEGDIVTLTEPNVVGNSACDNRAFAWSVAEADCFIRECDIEPYIEDKPVFKVGDLAKIVGNKCSHYFDMGEVVRIIGTTDVSAYDFKAEYLDGHDFGYVTTNDIEPYTEPEPEQGPVKLYCVKDYSPGVWITKGKIYKLDKSGNIHFDDGYTRNFDSLPKPSSITNSLVPLVKRPAKIGEWIYATGKDDFDSYKIGQIMRVSDCFDMSDGVCADDGKYNLFNFEYLVLDGYHPEPKYLNMDVVCGNHK